jgi:hypothetical protein
MKERNWSRVAAGSLKPSQASRLTICRNIALTFTFIFLPEIPAVLLGLMSEYSLPHTVYDLLGVLKEISSKLFTFEI